MVWREEKEVRIVIKFNLKNSLKGGVVFVYVTMCITLKMVILSKKSQVEENMTG